MNSSLFFLNLLARPQRWLLSCLAALLPLLGWGQLATYTIANGTSNNVATLAATNVASGITASDLTKNGIASTSSSSNFRGSGWPTTNSIASPPGASYGYISFSITPAAGTTYSITGFAYGTGSSGTGPAKYQWRSSADNYASAINGATLSNSVAPGSTFSLPASFTNLTGAVTFRLYGYNANAAGGTGGLAGDLLINGSVAGGNAPSLSATPTATFAAFTTPVGTPSAAQSYALAGSNLTTDVTVTAPAGYEVSQTNSTTGFAASQAVAQTSGSAAATIYVRLTGAATGTFAGNVVNAADGTATQSVAVTGTTAGLTVSPASLGAFTTPQSTASAAQTYTLTAAGLSGSVTVASPSGYQVAQSAPTTTSPGTYAATQTVTQANASAGRTIYVRLTGAAAGPYSGNVTNAASGVATQNVAVTGTVGVPAPSLTASAASLAAFNTLAGAPSAARSYTLTGSNLTADVTVAAPTGYEVSQTSATTGFAGSQTLVPVGSSVAATIFVRLAGTTAGAAGGSVTNASPGTTTLAVALAGTVVGKPTGTPTIATGTVTFESAGLSLGAADGTNLLVVVRPTASPATTPTDQTAYPGSLTYGAGTALGAGYVVLAAANTPGIAVTGLLPNTAYVAQVYTYNAGSASGFESYGPASGARAFTTAIQPPSAAGMLLFEDDFDYPAATALNSQGWATQANTGVNVVKTATGNVISGTYPQGAALSGGGTSSLVGLATSGEDLSRGSSRPAGTPAIYGAVLINVSAAQAGDYCLALAPNSSSYRSRVFIRSEGAGFAFGLTVGGENETYETTPTVFAFNTPYVLVMKAENSAATNNRDVASLYVLPAGTDISQEPTVPLLAVAATSPGNNTSALNSFVLRQGSASAAPTLTVDGVRLATGWGSAIGRPVFTDASGTLAAGSYYSLRAAGAGTKTTLSGPVFLEKQLNLDGGQVITTAANLLTLRARPLVGDGFEILVDPANTSFVDGPVAREAVGGPSLLFPIGRNGNYRPLTLNITSPPNGTTTYTAVQTEGAPADQTLGEPLARVSQVRYFSVTPSPVPAPGTFTGTVTLSFGTDDQVTDPSQPTFVVAKSDGAGWASIGSGVNTATSLTSDTFQDFSDFSLASTAADVTVNPLPVQLTSLAATRTASGVQVAWATASELNSARFEVERSSDGTTFGRVANVLAQGTTNQAHRYTALDRSAPASLLYYRLRQVDRDGTVAYSPTVAVATGSVPAEFTLAPNPTRASLTFLTEAPAAYTVRTPLGQAVRTGTTRAGTNTLAVDELPAGVYLFELHGPQGRVVRRFVKE